MEIGIKMHSPAFLIPRKIMTCLESDTIRKSTSRRAVAPHRNGTFENEYKPAFFRQLESKVPFSHTLNYISRPSSDVGPLARVFCGAYLCKSGAVAAATKNGIYYYNIYACTYCVYVCITGTRVQQK